jgi:uracil-DNA glycosylase
MNSSAASYLEAARAMDATGWGGLDFFRSGRAVEIARQADAQVQQGVHVLPPPSDVFRALRLTPPELVRAVILGQDPYPTPGDAHGLAFSMATDGRRLPMSLRTVFEALTRDTGLPAPAHGDLTRWARHGVLLLNTVLTVEAGKANSHKGLGWQALAQEVLDHLNAGERPVVFMLWGSHAQAAGRQLDRSRHCVIETVHPSPLARGSGPCHRFVAAQPFRQANDWLAEHGLEPVDWSLHD